jgi:hypothetical protein
LLFVADGVETGRLPSHDLAQEVAFWLGPDEGMGPRLAIGNRPRVHSDLGHARAILYAPGRPVSLVACTDGVVHVIDPIDLRYLERQRADFPDGFAMPVFAAQVDPRGRLLYLGAATHEARHRCLIERVVVHDLDRGRPHGEWVIPEPLTHMALSGDGAYLFGAGAASHTLWVLDAQTGQTRAAMTLDGKPQYVLPAG